ncbi:MAG: 16S rRNA (guanine(527)-N(7))-methyltransferase RsmG [Chitinophagaceae bacterium]|nr:16S rRNA (guanine(527)-N(7))-methyltransferase RsmG [Chitinophagaceae bacterium]
MDLILKYFPSLSQQQIEQFQMLGPLYKTWNEKINVISRKDIDSLYENHVLHSLSIAACFDFGTYCDIIDLGTGGGFPGIPLAIYFPEVRFHLVDSIAKKLKVVEAIAEETGIKNITTTHSRIEDIRNRKYDFVVSRAVAPLKKLWQWSRPLLKNQPAADSHSGLICLKGGNLDLEIRESHTKPRITDIYSLFPETFFTEKKLLFISN